MAVSRAHAPGVRRARWSRCGRRPGRRVRTTADHPFIVGDGLGDEVLTLKAAGDLDATDWLPLALGGPPGFAPELAPVMGAVDEATPATCSCGPSAARSTRCGTVEHPRGGARLHDIRRSGTLRLSEACAAGMDLRGATIGTVGNGAWNPLNLAIDEHFWRVRRAVHRRGPLHAPTRSASTWSFHPEREAHLVAEVVSYWQRHGSRCGCIDRRPRAWSPCPRGSSRRGGGTLLGAGRTSYTQRIPDLAWEQTHRAQAGAALRALGGRRVVVARQRRAERDPRVGHDQRRARRGRRPAAGRRGLVCSWRRGRTAKSTKETHWLRVSGADQVERGDVPRPRARPRRRGGRDRAAEQADRADRLPSLRRRARHGCASSTCGASSTTGPVYSLEVPGSHTVVATNGIS